MRPTLCFTRSKHSFFDFLKNLPSIWIFYFHLFWRAFQKCVWRLYSNVCDNLSQTLLYKRQTITYSDFDHQNTMNSSNDTYVFYDQKKSENRSNKSIVLKTPKNRLRYVQNSYQNWILDDFRRLPTNFGCASKIKISGWGRNSNVLVVRSKIEIWMSQIDFLSPRGDRRSPRGDHRSPWKLQLRNIDSTH